MRHIDKEGLMQHLLPIARVVVDAIMDVYSRGIPEVQLMNMLFGGETKLADAPVRNLN